MLLPVAGVLYQLRDYLKIVGRGKIRHHLTYESLRKMYNEKCTMYNGGISLNEKKDTLSD